MSTFERYLIASCLTIVLACSCSQTPQPDPTPMVAEIKPSASSIEPIRAGELMGDRLMFEFAIYYLPTPAKEPLVELDALLTGKFNGFQKVDKISPPTAGKAIAVRVLTNVKDGYAPPSIESLKSFGEGISPEQAKAVQGAKTALLLDFAYSREHVWDGMRAALELTSALAHATNGLVWDEDTRQLFSLEEWDKQRIADWTEKVPDISKHITLHAYKKGEYVRAITLGMAKFGLPDIVIDKFSWSVSRNVGHSINLFGQAIAEGATIKKDGEFDLDLRKIQNSKVREPQVKSLASHATAVALLSLNKGVWEEGDPKNRLIEITFDRYSGPDVHSRQMKMLGSLFGWEDSLTTPVENDAELEAASRLAKKKLPSLRTAFTTGLAPGEFIYVKAPFKTSDGGNEWMWVEVTSWKGETIKGLLQNEPFNVPNLHSGQIVEVAETIVFDFIRRYADGKMEGNETGKIIEKNGAAAKNPKERSAMHRIRCPWAKTEQYIEYHDREWGVPIHDDRTLFEFLVLEGAQAGLSWETILKKRDNYRASFDDFDPAIVAKYGKRKQQSLLLNAGIVRNRLKIAAAIQNAKALLAVQKEFETFDKYIWGFVDHKPKQNAWKSMAEVPSHTPESDAMSKDLKRRGFSFVGSTICYAFMQAVGMVNDHLVTCFRHQELG